MTTSVSIGSKTIQDQSTFVTGVSVTHVNDGDYLVARVVLHGNGVIVSGITASYGGVAMSLSGQASDNSNFNYAFIFTLRSPSMGSNSLYVAWTGSARGSIIVSSLFGVGYPGTITYASNGGTSTPVTVTVNNTAVGYLVLDAVATVVTTGLSAGAGQISEKNSTITDVNVAASYKIATGTSTTLTWTESVNRTWISVAMAFYGMEVGGIAVSPLYWI